MQILQCGFFFNRSRNGRLSSAYIQIKRNGYVCTYRYTRRYIKACILTLSISLTCYRPLKPRSINTMSAMFLSSYCCCLTNTDVGHLLCVVSTSQIPETISEKKKMFSACIQLSLPSASYIIYVKQLICINTQ